MAEFLDADCITKPRLWGRDTLTQARELLVRRRDYVKTGAGRRAEAQQLISDIDTELQRRARAGITR